MAAIENRVTAQDTMRVNYLARRYTHWGEDNAFHEAVELYRICSNDAERQTVRFWWNEGCRDYAGSEEHLKVLNALLLEQAAA